MVVSKRSSVDQVGTPSVDKACNKYRVRKSQAHCESRPQLWELLGCQESRCAYTLFREAMVTLSNFRRVVAAGIAGQLCVAERIALKAIACSLDPREMIPTAQTVPMRCPTKDICTRNWWVNVVWHPWAFTERLWLWLLVVTRNDVTPVSQWI